MSFYIEGKLTGLQDLFRKLDELESKVRKKITSKALQAGMKPLTKAARAGIHDDTGQLRRSLGTRTRTYRNSGVVVVMMGPRTGFKTTRSSGQFQNPTQYAHLVERGRKGVQVARARVLSSRVQVFGKQVAAVPPRPFMQMAWDSQKANVEQIIRDRILEGIEEAAK